MNSGRERIERRLAAILAADVAGYSRLIGEDEEGRHAALTSLRREVSDPKIAEHRGRIVKSTGDGLLVEFPSAVDAVRCAVEIQRELTQRNAVVPEAQRIEFRRWHSRRDHHRDLAPAAAIRDRVQFELHLQGQGRPELCSKHT